MPKSKNKSDHRLSLSSTNLGFGEGNHIVVSSNAYGYKLGNTETPAFQNHHRSRL